MRRDPHAVSRRLGAPAARRRENRSDRRGARGYHTTVVDRSPAARLNPMDRMDREASALSEFIPPAGIVRLLIVVVGGLVVLQSTQGLDPQKLAYLAVAGIAMAFSFRAVWRLRDRAMFEAAVPWLIASAVLSALIVLSLPVALASGTPPGQWLRDAATYGLFAAVPVLALDAAASMRSRLLLALAVAVTITGTLSFAVYWITARGIATLPFDMPLLSTASLPTALFVVSLAAAVVDRPRRIAWIIMGGLALGFFLVTGSRSALFFVIAFPAVILAAGRSFLARSTVASAGIGLVAFVFVAGVQGALSGAGRDAAPIDDPPPTAFASASASTSSSTAPTATPTPTPTPPPASGPGSTFFGRLQRFLAAPDRDGSIRERYAQYEVAWNTFAASPLVGRGLGHPLVWTRVDGTVRRDFAADTPLVLPAKLGIIGVLWLVILVVVWVRFLRRLHRTAGLTIPWLALTALAGILAALAWSGWVIEDKGLSFSLMFLLALAFVEIERAATQRRGEHGALDTSVHPAG